MGEVAKILGAKWKELTESEKAPFEELASKDKARYIREMESYVPNSKSNLDKKSPTTSKKINVASNVVSKISEEMVVSDSDDEF